MGPPQRPLFPLWVQKRIPFVRMAGENPAYCAFRERRKRRAWFAFGLLGATGRRGPSSLGCLMALGFGFFLLIPVALLSPFGSPRQVLLFAVLGVAILVVAAIWMQNTAGRRIPLRANAAFNPQAPHAALALDLWQCGVTGRQIAEAILLEGLERLALLNLIAQVLGCGVFLLVLLAPAPLWAQITYSIIIVLVSAAHFHLAMGSFPFGASNKLIAGLNARWRRSEDIWTRLKRDLPRMILDFVIGVASIIGLLIFLAIIIRLIGAIVTRLPSGVETWMWLQGLGVAAAFLSLILGVAVLGIFKPLAIARLEKLLAQSDEAFEVYIRKELLQDPDALARSEEPPGQGALTKAVDSPSQEKPRTLS